MNKLAIALWMSSPKKESEVATSLVNHICSQCEHALRTSDERHHLLRYLPMKYSKIWNRWLTGSLDTDKEILGTICALWWAPHSKYVGEKYNNAPIVFAPTRVCPSDSFLERAE
jgi:hypothetical protein